MSTGGDPVRWGILSTAHITAKFLAGAAQVPGFELLAVGSRDGERARTYAAEHGVERAYASYKELLGDPAVEAVYIPLPNALHVPWTIEALRAGKHVLCEKPLSRRAVEAERAYALAREHGLLLSEAFMYRHHPQIGRLRALLAEGAIGALRAVRSQFSFPVLRADDVRLSRALDGGALMDVGCYCLSASRLLAGEPETVAAVRTLGGDGVDVRFAGALRFPGGVVAHFDAGLDVAHRSELEVVGSEGSLELADPWHGVRPVIEIRRGEDAERVEVEAANPYARQVENFCAAVRGTDELLLGADDGIAQARAIEALHAAAEASG